MSPRRSLRSLVPVFVGLVVSVSAVACGGADAGGPVAAGAGPSVTSTTETTAVPGVGGDPSTVDGLSAAELREAVEAPDPAGRARTTGPVAQPVRLASGATVWRVRIPGRFAVRSARVVVSVGGRRLGEGVPGSHLQSLVAVTRDPRVIVRGAVVTYQWSGGPSVDAGRLAVVR